MKCISLVVLLWSSGASAQLYAPVNSYDVNNAPFQGAVAMTVGVSYVPQRSVGVLATVAGNVTFQLVDGSTLTVPVVSGWQMFPFAVTQVTASTATATYVNLK